MQPTTRRAGEVARVVARNGLGLVGEFAGVQARRLGRRTDAARPHVGPPRVRRVLEELGPTFVKLGQVLSTRPDLVPPEYEAELARLQDSAPWVPAAQVVALVESALDVRLADAYARFDLAPLAAASIGQVHAAMLPDGTDVVVKVRRPGVVEQVDIDLQLLARVATIAARRAFFDRYDPAGLAREFDTTMRGELDYGREAQNATAIAASFGDDDSIHVPAIIWSHTREGVITEERIRGIKIDDVRALESAGSDRAVVAHRFADAYLAMVFEHGLYHADPHPGNVFVEADDRVAFVDFGMVGVVVPRTVRGLAIVLSAMAALDAAGLADGLLALGVAAEHVDRPALEADLSKLLDKYGHVSLQHLRIGPLLNELMAIVRRRQLRLPSDLALLLKTVMMCEGVAANLDPHFELVPVLLPHAARLTGDGSG